MITLANGLRVVHVYEPSSAMACVNVLYDVGSRDEKPGATGRAHLFEHLMFGGSRNVPSFDGALQRAGGKNNAWTSPDFTNFYDLVPAINIETALWLEADRMLEPRLDREALEVQKKVVVEEFKQTCLNRPYGDLGHHLLAAVYGDHPYRTPPIGATPHEIERVTTEDAQEWFHSHYAPNNAVLAIGGNIPEGEAYRLAEKWFADIPRRDIALRDIKAPKPLDHPAPVILEGEVPHTVVMRVALMDPFGTRAYYAADMISDILANGRASRFYREVMLADPRFTAIDANIAGSEHHGTFNILATLRDSGPQAEAEALEVIDSQLQRLREEAPTEREMERCRRRTRADRRFNLLDLTKRTTARAIDTLHGMETDESQRRYEALTASDILTTANNLFQPTSLQTLIYRPHP